ncbi:MAG: hypothetical protein Q9169_004710 [Polycauliona sp. 2 TL-2023]
MTAPEKRTTPLAFVLKALYILFSPAIFIALILYIILTQTLALPYMLFHFSANYGIRASDKPIVQRYLDIFQHMHPALALKLSEMYQSEKWRKEYKDMNLIPPMLKFWPHEKKTEYAWFIISASVTDYTYSVMAGLLFVLEEHGFPRRVLWDFLRTEVEERSADQSVNDEEKREFRRVMDKMCTGYVPTIINPWGKKEWVRQSEKDSEGRDDMMGEKGFTLPESAPVGIQIVPLRRGDGMEWLLYEKGLIVPMDWPAFQKIRLLTRFGLWGKVKTDMDLEDGKMADAWQYVDLRKV